MRRAYSHLKEAEFSIRFAGLRFTFYCRRTRAYKRGIRKARALLIREKVITAQPSQHWRLDAKRTHWTFRSFVDIPPVPVIDVYWALADNRNLIETYKSRGAIQWKIIKTIAQCCRCDNSLEWKHNYWDRYMGVEPQGFWDDEDKWCPWTPVCEKCLAEFHDFARAHTGEMGGYYMSFLKRPRIEYIASQDRSRNVRWVRRFIAQGSFTVSEFKVLCEQYGNVCLRCGEKRSLVADHVISLADGGRDDITNIQPLCSECNNIKFTKSTDHRRRVNKRHSTQIVETRLQAEVDALKRLQAETAAEIDGFPRHDDFSFSHNVPLVTLRPLAKTPIFDPGIPFELPFPLLTP